jgi:hypothetical protein
MEDVLQMGIGIVYEELDSVTRYCTSETEKWRL